MFRMAGVLFVGFLATLAGSARAADAPSLAGSWKFSFLNDEHSLGSRINWGAPGPSQLWRYHLHYFEWAWSFAAHADQHHQAQLRDRELAGHAGAPGAPGLLKTAICVGGPTSASSAPTGR